VLDIELGRERHAGVAIINAINKHSATPVLVVSAMPAAIYRSIMKALDAWDYLQKTTFEEADFVDTFLDILRSAKSKPVEKIVSTNTQELQLDPLRQNTAIWRGQRVNLPLTAQRILAALHARRGEVVSYDELYKVVKSGRNRDNIRKHVSTIRDAFKEIDTQFDGIENVPMRGFRWAEDATQPRRQPPAAHAGAVWPAGVFSWSIFAVGAGHHWLGLGRAARRKRTQLPQLPRRL
jgi:DNA-binding response OmpR family regulator